MIPAVGKKPHYVRTYVRTKAGVSLGTGVWGLGSRPRVATCVRTYVHYYYVRRGGKRKTWGNGGTTTKQNILCFCRGGGGPGHWVCTYDLCFKSVLHPLRRALFKSVLHPPRVGCRPPGNRRHSSSSAAGFRVQGPGVKGPGACLDKRWTGPSRLLCARTRARFAFGRTSSWKSIR